MPMIAQDCYARAAECDKRVGMAKRFEIKVQHRELAQQWRYLASEIEQIASLRAEDRKSAAGETPSAARGSLRISA
jgi:elongation factor P--beta-lysine ligase